MIIKKYCDSVFLHSYRFVRLLVYFRFGACIYSVLLGTVQAQYAMQCSCSTVLFLYVLCILLAAVIGKELILVGHCAD